MKFKNQIKNIIIFILLFLLIGGYFLNKQNSQSRKNEIFNITKQILSKNYQISQIQKNLFKENKDINNLINLNSITFKKSFTNKKLKNLKNVTLDKYKTNDILFTANFKALASAYIDLYKDNEIILATYDGIFALAKINNLENFKKIKSNIKNLIKYEKFYFHDHYGIKDILVDNDDLYVSLIAENKKNCYALEIIKSKINNEFLNFETIYKAPDCIQEKNDYEFLAQQGAGGRMFKNSENTILFTTGEFRVRPLAQNIKNHFGKILEINLKNKSVRVVSFGHRNPQGLYYSQKYDFIISTEHGPKGGDEVNINIKPNDKIKNFGWPISSYGEHYYKNYSKEKLKTAPLKKSHSKFGFEEPIIYFVPSIGISEIVSINELDTEFIFGAMGSEVSEKDLSIHYIKLNNDRTKVIEHNYEILNERVRDIVISKDKKTAFLFLETTSSLGVLKIK